MAQEVISSAILIIAAIIATIALVNAVYPSIFSATDSVSSASSTASDRMKTAVQISMINAPDTGTLTLWVKNSGSAKIPANRIAYTDVYFGDRGQMARASYNASDPSDLLQWSYVLDDVDGDGSWGPGETLEITIIDSSGVSFTAGYHQVQLVLYNSASFEDQIQITN